MNKSESIVKLSAALVKAQASMGAAKKDSDNPFFKSKYADLNAIRAAVMPALNENGISVLQNPSLDTLTTVLLHESGEFISSEIKIVSKSANNPQDYGSALSYARRYALQAMLCVGAEDDDGEGVVRGGEARKTVSKKPASKPTAEDF